MLKSQLRPSSGFENELTILEPFPIQFVQLASFSEFDEFANLSRPISKQSAKNAFMRVCYRALPQASPIRLSN